jgi:hypothetical protein
MMNGTTETPNTSATAARSFLPNRVSHAEIRPMSKVPSMARARPDLEQGAHASEAALQP